MEVYLPLLSARSYSLALGILFDLACMDTVSLHAVMGAVSLLLLIVVPANGCSRAHEFYCEWQFTLDPSREPHVNVPEVVRDEISSPQGHEEDRDSCNEQNNDHSANGKPLTCHDISAHPPVVTLFKGLRVIHAVGIYFAASLIQHQSNHPCRTQADKWYESNRVEIKDRSVCVQIPREVHR